MAMTCNVFFLIGSTMAERFLYAPLLGASLAAAALLDAKLPGKNLPARGPGEFFTRRPALICAVALLAGLMSLKTVARNRVWQDNFTLFAADAASAPGSARIQYNCGTAIMQGQALPEQNPARRQELLQAAIARFQSALRIDPRYFDAQQNLGACYYQAKQYPESIAASRRALELKPGDGRVLSNLGNACFRSALLAEAIEALQKAIGAGHVTSDIYNYLGGAYFGSGDYRGAVAAFEKGLALNPAQPETLNNMGSAYGALKEYEKAVACFRKSADLQPANPQTWLLLSMTCREMGDPGTAATYLQKANELAVQH
jgi:tetratricopeptide (TPR) repeat protein